MLHKTSSVFSQGMMTKNEQEIFEKLKTPSNKYFVPLVWATTLLSRAKKEDRIHTEYAKAELVRVSTVTLDHEHRCLN